MSRPAACASCSVSFRLPACAGQPGDDALTSTTAASMPSYESRSIRSVPSNRGSAAVPEIARLPPPLPVAPLSVCARSPISSVPSSATRSPYSPLIRSVLMPLPISTSSKRQRPAASVCTRPAMVAGKPLTLPASRAAIDTSGDGLPSVPTICAWPLNLHCTAGDQPGAQKSLRLVSISSASVASVPSVPLTVSSPASPSSTTCFSCSTPELQLACPRRAFLPSVGECRLASSVASIVSSVPRSASSPSPSVKKPSPSAASCSGARFCTSTSSAIGVASGAIQPVAFAT